VATIEEALDGLYGDRERFRPMLEPEAILKQICRTAEMTADRKGRPAWSIISDITGHGSGVSNAIYQVYRKQPAEVEEPVS
jgi:hypothetical protein